MGSSNKQFVVLLILPLMFATPKSAPVQSGQQKSQMSLAELSTKTQQFYCTSVLVKNLAKFMVHVSKSHLQFMHIAAKNTNYLFYRLKMLLHFLVDTIMIHLAKKMSI